MTKKKTETVVVTLRIKEALRRRLEASAARNEVSVNNEITRRIEESFVRSEMVGLTENVDRLSALYERARASDELMGRYQDSAKKCLALAQTHNDPKVKGVMLSLADAWLSLATQSDKEFEATVAEAQATKKDINPAHEARLKALARLRPDQGPELLPIPQPRKLSK